MASTLASLDHLGAVLGDALGETASRLRAATVQVRAQGAGGCGSGVIWQADGLIITNAHCVLGRSVRVELHDGRAFDARVVASDPRRDLASLAIAARDLPAVTPGDPGRLRAGELVLAVGNPWGVAGAVSVGVMHANGGGDGGHEPRWVRADVRLAPGNSGGPLADARGRVVGINTLIASGLALAVPITAVERFLARAGRRRTIGVAVRPVTVTTGRGARLGLLVLEVASRSAAEQAGMLAGDVIIAVGTRALRSPDDLPALLDEAAPESAVALELLRAGGRRTLEVIARDEPPEARAA